MIILPAWPKDIEELAALERASVPHPHSKKFFETELNQEKARIFVAREEGKIVALIDFWIVADELDVQDIVVHPSHRRKKIATELFKAMCEALENSKIVHLEVRESNSSARAFYEKLGFKIMATRKNYYSNGENALQLKLVL